LFDYAERCSFAGGGIGILATTRLGERRLLDIEIARNRITDIAGRHPDRPLFSWETDGPPTDGRGRQRKAAMPKGPHSQRITVADNEIAHCGRFTRKLGCSSATMPTTRSFITTYDNLLRHSVGSVQDFGPCQATGNIVEYNHLHDIGQGMLSDLAAVYTCSPDSRIRFNLIHDVSRRITAAGEFTWMKEATTCSSRRMSSSAARMALCSHHNRDITAENNIWL
jgi:hypothetical protein